MPCFHRSLRGPAVLVLAVLLFMSGGAGSARALSISGLVIAPTASNTASSLVNSGNSHFQVGSATDVTGASPGPVADVVGASVGFGTRYAAILAADRESAGGSMTQTATSSYTIVFTVDNPTGATYQVDVSSILAGAITLVDDSTGTASATLGGVTGTLDGAADGALSLAGLGSLSSASSTDVPFSLSSGTLSLVDSALSRTFTLGFDWTSSVTSGRDEAAIRLGLAGGVISSTADDYPGVGARSASLDGHLVSVGVTVLALPTPEPGTGTLVGVGLIGLGIASRRRSG